MFRFKRKTKKESNPKTKALLIGINYTGTSSQLNGCVNDVNNMYRWLTKQCGYDPADIRVLTDENHVPAQYQPTKKNILESFKWLHDGLTKEQTNLFVHYSGHGSWSYDSQKEELDHRDESICPLDYTTAGMIKDDALRRLVVDPIASKPTVKLTCLFDCCHSGTVLDLRYEYEVKVASDHPEKRTFLINQNKKQKETKADVTLLSGSLDKQYSADAWIDGKAQGAMTWGFLQVMRQHESISRKISYKKLLAHLQILLKNSHYEQIPHLCTGHYFDLKKEFGV